MEKYNNAGATADLDRGGIRTIEIVFASSDANQHWYETS